jgi:hypothetical protein
VTVHQRLAAAVVLLGIVGAVVAAVGVARGGPAATLRSFLILASALVGVQVVVGGILWLRGYRPEERLHYLYGALVLAAIPAARRYAAGARSGRGEASLLLAGCVALVLLAVRAMTTGGG